MRLSGFDEGQSMHAGKVIGHHLPAAASTLTRASPFFGSGPFSSTA